MLRRRVALLGLSALAGGCSGAGTDGGIGARLPDGSGPEPDLLWIAPDGGLPPSPCVGSLGPGPVPDGGGPLGGGFTRLGAIEQALIQADTLPPHEWTDTSSVLAGGLRIETRPTPTSLPVSRPMTSLAAWRYG